MFLLFHEAEFLCNVFGDKEKDGDNKDAEHRSKQHAADDSHAHAVTSCRARAGRHCQR